MHLRERHGLGGKPTESYSVKQRQRQWWPSRDPLRSRRGIRRAGPPTSPASRSIAPSEAALPRAQFPGTTPPISPASGLTSLNSDSKRPTTLDAFSRRVWCSVARRATICQTSAALEVSAAIIAATAVTESTLHRVANHPDAHQSQTPSLIAAGRAMPGVCWSLERLWHHPRHLAEKVEQADSDADAPGDHEGGVKLLSVAAFDSREDSCNDALSQT